MYTFVYVCSIFEYNRKIPHHSWLHMQIILLRRLRKESKIKTFAILDECLTLPGILVLADYAGDKEGVYLPKPVPGETPMRQRFHLVRTHAATHWFNKRPVYGLYGDIQKTGITLSVKPIVFYKAIKPIRYKRVPLCSWWKKNGRSNRNAFEKCFISLPLTSVSWLDKPLRYVLFSYLTRVLWMLWCPFL